MSFLNDTFIEDNYSPDDIELEYIKPSKELMNKQNLPTYKRESLEFIYKEMTMVLNRPELYEDPVQHVEALEYSMQIMWGFSPYSDYHSYWNKIKGCTCPQMDNYELVGNGRRYISGDCPFHGDNK